MFLSSAIGFGVLAALLAKRRAEAPEEGFDDSEERIKSMFTGKYDLWPKGTDKFKMDGAGTLKLPSHFNIEFRNPMNQLFTYPQAKASTRLVKDGAWKEAGVLNKDAQLAMLRDKFLKDDYILLTPMYKQLNGTTVAHQPKINLKYYPVERMSCKYRNPESKKVVAQINA